MNRRAGGRPASTFVETPMLKPDKDLITRLTALVGEKYALTDPDLQALHAVAPCLMTWDDHEVENDYADQWSANRQTDPRDFLRRRAETGSKIRVSAEPPDVGGKLLRRLRKQSGPLVDDDVRANLERFTDRLAQLVEALDEADRSGGR